MIDPPEPDRKTPPAAGGLGRVAIAGARWTVGARMVRIFFTMGTLAVLSRLLDPAAFGTIALILFVIGLAQMLGDFGARLALVQRPDINETDRSSVFWFNGTLYLLLFVLDLVFAPQIAGLFGAPEMTEPMRWICPIFLIQAFQGVSLSLLERTYAFKAIAVAETLGSILGSVAAVIAVLMGADVGALVIQVLISTLVTTVLVMVQAGWRPRAVFDLGRLIPLVKFGGYLTLAGMFQFASTNANRPIIGSGLSPEALGMVTVTSQIIDTPIKVIVQMVRKVMFPVLSSMQDDNPRIGRAYLKTMHALMVVMAPVCLGLVAVAEPLVAVLLGSGWEVVALLMGYMSVRALLNTVNDVNASLFQAKGWARFQFYWSLGSSIVTIAVLLACVPYGLEAIVAGRLAVSLVTTPINANIAFRMIELPMIAVLRTIAAPLLAAVTMAAGVMAAGKYLVADLSSVVQLLVLIPAGAFIYCAVMLTIDRKRSLELVRLGLRRT